MSDPTRSPEHWILLGAAVASALVLLGFALLVDPDPRGHGTHEQLGLWPCMAIELTGWPCPFCGGTTAFAHAAHGEVAAALRVQPVGALVALLAALAPFVALGVHVAGGDLYRGLRRMPARAMGTAAAAIVLAAWLYKIAAVRGWIG